MLLPSTNTSHGRLQNNVSSSLERRYIKLNTMLAYPSIINSENWSSFYTSGITKYNYMSPSSLFQPFILWVHSYIRDPDITQCVTWLSLDQGAKFSREELGSKCYQLLCDPDKVRKATLCRVIKNDRYRFPSYIHFWNFHYSSITVGQWHISTSGVFNNGFLRGSIQR